MIVLRGSRLAALLVVSIVFSPPGLRAQAADEAKYASLVVALSDAMAQYRRALAEYRSAWATYDAVAEAYWRSISEKRHMRSAKRANREPISLDDYVLTQPPVYTGPPKPRDPSKPQTKAEPPPYVPVVADFLAAAQREFKFVPRLPQSESEFKRAYARVGAGGRADQRTDRAHLRLRGRRQRRLRCPGRA